MGKTTVFNPNIPEVFFEGKRQKYVVFDGEYVWPKSSSNALLKIVHVDVETNGGTWNKEYKEKTLYNTDWVRTGEINGSATHNCLRQTVLDDLYTNITKNGVRPLFFDTKPDGSGTVISAEYSINSETIIYPIWEYDTNNYLDVCVNRIPFGSPIIGCEEIYTSLSAPNTGSISGGIFAIEKIDEENFRLIFFGTIDGSSDFLNFTSNGTTISVALCRTILLKNFLTINKSTTSIGNINIRKHSDGNNIKINKEKLFCFRIKFRNSKISLYIR